MPRGPSQVTVQHFTKSRAIAGTVLLVLGLPLAALGGWALASDLGRDDAGAADYTGAGVFLAHGFAFTVAGLVELATIRTNRADVVSLAPRLALERPSQPDASAALDGTPSLSPVLALAF